MKLLLAVTFLIGACSGDLPITDRADAELLKHGPDRVQSRTTWTPRDIYHQEWCNYSCQQHRELAEERRRLEQRDAQLDAHAKRLKEKTDRLRERRELLRKKRHAAKPPPKKAQCDKNAQRDPQVREECRRQRKGK